MAAGLLNEEPVDGGKSGVHAVQIDDRRGGQRDNPLKIFGAEIDLALSLLRLGDEGKAMGAADDGAGGVEKADPGVEKRTGAFGRGIAGAGTQPFGFFDRKLGKGPREGDTFHTEEGKVAAAGVAPPSAGQDVTVGGLDRTAQVIDPAAQFEVVMQGIQGKLPE